MTIGSSVCWTSSAAWRTNDEIALDQEVYHSEKATGSKTGLWPIC